MYVRNIILSLQHQLDLTSATSVKVLRRNNPAKYKVIMRDLLLLFIWLVPAVASADATRTDSIYRCIDDAIANASVYLSKREARISSLKRQYYESRGYAARYASAFKIYNEYKAFVNDSAIVWLSRAEYLARRNGDVKNAGYCVALKAFQCSTAGMYMESAEMLASVNVKELTREGLLAYYTSQNHLYKELGFYTRVNSLRDQYYRRSHMYADSLMTLADKNSDIYLQLMESKCYDRNDLSGALRYNTMRMKGLDKDSHEYSIVAFYRFLDYKKMNDTGNWTYWLAISALGDIRNAVMDQGALWELANYLNTTGHPARSYKYINFAWQCAETFGTRVRSTQISSVLTAIDSSYQTIMQKQKERLVIMIALISLFAVSVLMLFIYVNRQRGKLKLTRDELRRKNGQLMRLNQEMSQVNENLDESNRQLTETDRQLHEAIGRLNESNRVKEKYIGLSLRQCSIYIENMEKLRKEVLTMLKNKRHTELMTKMRSHEYRDRQQQELFDIFDTTFIHLFPTFVDDFNKLLRPEERIHLDDTSRLNTDLRIFALIRLGIDDSSKIAEFLHYSVNTIYNYRARIKNGAICGRDEFEKKVKEIGATHPA